MGTDGCPQADGRSEHEFTRIYSHIANIRRVHQAPQVSVNLKKWVRRRTGDVMNDD